MHAYPTQDFSRLKNVIEKETYQKLHNEMSNEEPRHYGDKPDIAASTLETLPTIIQPIVRITLRIISEHSVVRTYTLH